MKIAVAVGSGSGTKEETLGLQNASFRIVKCLKQNKIDSFIHKVNELEISVPECDAVFNLCDNDYGKKDSFISYTSLLEKNKKPYTGNKLNCFKKANNKLAWSSHLSVAKYLPFRTDLLNEVEFMDCKFIIKHKYNHGSLSLPNKCIFNKVNDKVKSLLNTGKFYCEQFINGPEVSVAYLPGFKPMYGIKDLANEKILDFNTKWNGKITTKLLNLTHDDEQYINNMIADIKKSFNITSYMRLDLRKDNNNFYLVDINPNCSLDEAGSFLRILNLNNISYSATIKNILFNDLGI